MLTIIDMNNPAKKRGRLSREEWLLKALNVLAAQGPGELNIQSLAEALGVSRGSFYWHFKDRNDFIRALLDFWHEEYTKPVPEAVNAEGGSSRDKFRRFIQVIHENDLARFDMPIRSWALQDPAIAALVRRTDNFRLGFLRSVLEEAGFSGYAMELRARSCIAYLTMDKQMLDPTGALTSVDDLDELCNFFIGEKR